MKPNKGMTITSEAFLSIGIILVSIVLAMVAGRVIEFQALGVFEQTQENFLNEIDSIITSLGPYDGTREVQYNPPVENYDLYVQENSVIEINIDETPARASFTEKHIENTFIQNAESLCIVQSDGQLQINEGRCTEDLTDFCSGTRCEDGQQCYVDKGETCVSDDCACPPQYEGYENDPASTDFCKPDYTPVDTVEDNGQVVDHTTKTGCLTEPYFQYREEGETCHENFECNNTLKCLEDIDKNNFYCCPEGERYDESEGECLEHILDKGEECDPLDDLCDDEEDLSCLETADEFEDYDNACCPDGEQWNGTHCEVQDLYTLVFVPIDDNQGYSQTNFETAVEEQGDFFIESFPLQDCPEKVEIKTTDPCEMDNACDLSSDAAVAQTLWDIYDCATDEFDEFNMVTGILTQGGCGDTAGFSFGITPPPTNVAAWNSEVVTAHEIGHEYGLNDEYLDVCTIYNIFKDDPNIDEDETPGMVPPWDSNCLEHQYDGGDPIIHPSITDDYCLTGEIPPDYAAYCYGNKNEYGGRDIMSYVAAPGPRAFAEPSMEHLEQQEDFQCD